MEVQDGIKERIKTIIKEPKHYQVIMHNDDYTPMDFVVEVLMMIFGKQEKDAVDIMLMVHEGGKAVVDTYTYDIAQSKVRRVTSLAKESGYPFRLTIEEK